ncbi:hypothetical protein CLOP_g14128 [Closterium sp. NIES-67]|nr:hypothetical protein CLOP_g14128 [Closterium sp. NIES-67]
MEDAHTEDVGGKSPLRQGTRSSTASAWASVEAAVTSGALTDGRKNTSAAAGALSRATTPSLPTRNSHSARNPTTTAINPSNTTKSHAIEGARSRSWAGVGPYRKDVIRYVTLDASAGKLAASKSAKYLSSRRSAVALWHKAQKLAGPVGTVAATAVMPADPVAFAVSALAGRPITPSYAAAGAGGGGAAGAAGAAGGPSSGTSRPQQLQVPPRPGFAGDGRTHRSPLGKSLGGLLAGRSGAGDSGGQGEGREGGGGAGGAGGAEGVKKMHRRTGSFGLGRKGSKKHTALPAAAAAAAASAASAPPCQSTAAEPQQQQQQQHVTDTIMTDQPGAASREGGSAAAAAHEAAEAAAAAAAAAAEEAGAIVPPQPSAFYLLPESAGVAVPYVKREEQERMTTFCVLAIVLKLRDDFIDGAQGLDDVVDFFNAAAGSWDVKKLCKRAVDLHRQYLVLKLAAHEWGRVL